jgi:hypothetical protein
MARPSLSSSSPNIQSPRSNHLIHRTAPMVLRSPIPEDNNNLYDSRHANMNESVSVPSHKSLLISTSLSISHRSPLHPLFRIRLTYTRSKATQFSSNPFHILHQRRTNQKEGLREEQEGPSFPLCVRGNRVAPPRGLKMTFSKQPFWISPPGAS